MMNEMKYKGEKFQGPEHLAPYPFSRMAPSIDVVAIAAADDIPAVQATGGLHVFAEQIEILQEKTRNIK